MCAEEQTACKNTVAKIDVVSILPDVSVLDAGARPQVAQTEMQKIAAVGADQATILLTAKLVKFETGKIEQSAAAEAAFRRRIATDRRTVIDSPLKRIYSPGPGKACSKHCLIVVLIRTEVGLIGLVNCSYNVTVGWKIQIIKLIHFDCERQLANIEVLVRYARITDPDRTLTAASRVSENSPPPVAELSATVN